MSYTKYDFIKDFVEQDMQFNNYDEAQLIFFKSQLTNLGIEVGTLDEKRFNEISDELHRIYEEIIKATNNNNNNMEDNTMKNINETAATIEIEEVTMGEVAKAKLEAVKDKLADGFEFAVEHVEVVAETVTEMANMPENELENYLLESGKTVLDNIVHAIKNFATKNREEGKKFPFFADAVNADADKADDIVKLIKEVLDEEGKSGWGKFKAIVKEIAKWLLKLLLKVGAIVLKLAITVVVGSVKIGATMLVTAGKAASIINREVIKPTVKAGKTAWAKHKDNVEKRKMEADKEDFDEFEEEIFAE